MASGSDYSSGVYKPLAGVRILRRPIRLPSSTNFLRQRYEAPQKYESLTVKKVQKYKKSNFYRKIKQGRKCLHFDRRIYIGNKRVGLSLLWEMVVFIRGIKTDRYPLFNTFYCDTWNCYREWITTDRRVYERLPKDDETEEDGWHQVM